MQYISQKDLEDFIGKCPKDGDERPQSYCDSAMECVKGFLGYNPELQEYTTKFKGDDGSLGVLEAFPVTEIKSFKIDDVDVDVAMLEPAAKNYIEFTDGSLFIKGHKYKITYKAGYEQVPSLIKTTALQIASLYWESAGGNLAVSSTSFADTGSRVFNNFKADRFLEQIAGYKRVF